MSATPITSLSQISPEMVLSVVGKRAKKSQQIRQTEIIPELLKCLGIYGERFNFLEPHVLWDVLSQVGHESAEFCTTKEFGTGQWYWPHIGRTLLQRTHLEGYQKFTRWIWNNIDPNVPDLSLRENWHLMEQFPYAFLSIPEFWTLHTLWRYSHENRFADLTKKINGGYNGLAHRVQLRGRFGLMLMGYKMQRYAYRDFQRDHGLPETDKFDEQTHDRMFAELKKLPALTIEGVVVPDPVEPSPQPPAPDDDFFKTLMEFLMSIFKKLIKFAQGGLGKTLLGTLLGGLGIGTVGDVDVGGVGLNLMKGEYGAIISALVSAFGLYAQTQDADDDRQAVGEGHAPPPLPVDVGSTLKHGFSSENGAVAEAIAKFIDGTLVTDDSNEIGLTISQMADNEVDSPEHQVINLLKFLALVQKGQQAAKLLEAKSE